MVKAVSQSTEKVVILVISVLLLLVLAFLGQERAIVGEAVYVVETSCDEGDLCMQFGGTTFTEAEITSGSTVNLVLSVNAGEFELDDIKVFLDFDSSELSYVSHQFLFESAEGDYSDDYSIDTGIEAELDSSIEFYISNPGAIATEEFALVEIEFFVSEDFAIGDEFYVQFSDSSSAQSSGSEIITNKPVINFVVVEEAEECEEITWYADSDGDGYGDEADTEFGCTQPEGYVVDSSDCDDNEASVYQLSTWYVDVDGDQFTAGTIEACYQPEATISWTDGEDCDDNSELVQGTDTWYVDVDGDQFTAGTIEACYQPEATISWTDGEDCDDSDSTVGVASNWYPDLDLDGYADYDNVVEACYQPGAFYYLAEDIAEESDCDDSDSSMYKGCPLDEDGDGYTTVDDCADQDASSYPGALEICDLLDNDCNQVVDDSCIDADSLVDADGDGYYSEASGGNDCADEDAGTNPGATEVCDLLDNDCDGEVDEDDICLADAAVDLDLDGYDTDSDCDDTDATVNPGATEICSDSIDNDCSGEVDDGCEAESTGVTSIVITDGNGDQIIDISALVAGEVYTISVEVEGSIVADHLLIVQVLEDTDGTVQSFTSQEMVAIDDGGSESLSVSFTPTADGDYSVETYVWSDWPENGGESLVDSTEVN